MKALVRYFSHNRVAANMLMLSIVVLGLLIIPFTHKEILPPLEHDKIIVTVTMPGSSPSQSEKHLCVPLEIQLKRIAGIESFKSHASNSQCLIDLSLLYSADVDAVLAKVNTVIADARLPEKSQRPRVTQVVQDLMLIRLTLSGQVSYSSLHEAATKVRDDLLSEGLTDVRLRDVRPQQMMIELNAWALEQYSLSFSEVHQALLANANDIPVGQLDSGHGQASIVLTANQSTLSELSRCVIRANPDGSQLLLKDVATIHQSHAQDQLQSRLNGIPAVSVSVYQDASNSVVDIAKTVKSYTAYATNALPESIQLTLVQDNSAYFNDRITMLVKNAIAGLILVFICLMLFLRLRLAFWVSVGIPVAFIGAFIVLYFSGYSINMVSTFALLLVLGLVVDDAIIIAENIYSHQQRGRDDETAEPEVQGTLELARPVIFAALTTAITFLPLAFLPGMEGRLMAQIPLLVIATLFFSLVECFFILPAHLSPSHNCRSLWGGKKPFVNNNEATQLGGSDGLTPIMKRLQWLIDHGYRPLLAQCLRWRYAVTLSFFGLLMFCLSLIVSGRHAIDFYSSVDAEVATGFVRFTTGSDPEKTRLAIAKMEAAALALKETLAQEYEGVDQITHIRALVADDANSGHIYMNLADSDARQISGEDIMTRWRHHVGAIPAATDLWFSAQYRGAEAVTGGVRFQLESEDTQMLMAATKALVMQLEQYPEVSYASDSYAHEQQEIHVSLKPLAKELGLSLPQVAKQISQVFMGVELPAVQYQGQHQSLMLHVSEQQRNSLWHLENMQIHLNDGSKLPLYALAKIDFASYQASVQRLNGKRIAYVNVGLRNGKHDKAGILNHIQADFFQNLAEAYPSVVWRRSNIDGHQQVIKERLWYGFWVAMFLMFVLMASLFHSYLQPLIVLSAVPFALIGAMMGHWFFAESLTIWSMAGIVAVSGIVVNDNMVLIFYINEKLKQSVPLYTAITEAGAKRFRPIMLTTITTFFGLLPMMFEGSWEAQFLIPMAIAIGFGELFATAVSLLLVPCLYQISHDMRLMLARWTRANASADA